MPHVSSNGKYDHNMISTIVTDNCDFYGHIIKEMN